MRLQIVVGWAADLQRRHNLGARSVIYHLSAAKWHFGVRFGDTTLFEHRTVKSLRTGLVLQERSQLCPAKGKLPTTMEMCRDIWLESRDPGCSIRQQMLGFAQCLSFLLMLRASEYTQSDSHRTAPSSTHPPFPSGHPSLLPRSPSRSRSSTPNDHAIRSKGIEFTCRLPDSSVAVLTAAKLHRHPYLSLPWSAVLSVRLLFPGCKRDQTRRGTVYIFDCEDYHDPCEHINIPWLCFHWTRTTSFASGDDLFFSYPSAAHLSGRYSLRPDDVCENLRRTAAAAGFEPADVLRFSAHSNRYGGACAARNAGASDSTIMFIGKWKSLSTSLDYQAAARGTMRAVSQLQQAPGFQTGFTSKDVRDLNTRPSDYNSQYSRPRQYAAVSDRRVVTQPRRVETRPSL